MAEVRHVLDRIGGLAAALVVAASAGLGCAGCAAAAHQPAQTRPVASACDFRAPTSCWTLAPRFPRTRTQPADSAPPELPPSPQVLVEASP